MYFSAVKLLPYRPQSSLSEAECPQRQSQERVGTAAVMFQLFMQRSGVPVIDRSAAQPLQLQRTSLFQWLCRLLSGDTGIQLQARQIAVIQVL